MAKYCTLADCADPVVAVTNEHLEGADVYVDLALGTAGISPVDAASITLPNAILKAVAVAWAKRLAAIDGSMGDNSLMIDKANQYKTSADMLAKQLNRAALGLAEPTNGGFGSITLGRA
ncbi:MAG: hypothetical protein BVN35_09600 [Proteobacteria bacterium ST_bin11]|nr:MAG: hypothetical protein BVN35_09600 [Proteobacteria bacterium ST_bin11]